MYLLVLRKKIIKILHLRTWEEDEDTHFIFCFRILSGIKCREFERKKKIKESERASKYNITWIENSRAK